VCRLYGVRPSMSPSGWLDDDLGFTCDMIERNFSNYSAWHLRALTRTQLSCRPGQHTTTGATTSCQQELQWIKQGVYTEPSDQSLWLYHCWLLHQAGRPPLRLVGAVVESRSEPDKGDCRQSVLLFFSAACSIDATRSRVDIHQPEGDVHARTSGAFSPLDADAASQRRNSRIPRQQRPLQPSSDAWRFDLDDGVSVPGRATVILHLRFTAHGGSLPSFYQACFLPTLGIGGDTTPPAAHEPALEVTYQCDVPGNPHRGSVLHLSVKDSCRAAYCIGGGGSSVRDEMQPSDGALLEQELAAVDELLQIEPNCYYAVLAKCWLLESLRPRDPLLLANYKRLQTLDPLRRGFYQDCWSNALVRMKVLEQVERATEGPLEAIDLSSLGLTCLGEQQLLPAHGIKRIDVSNNSIRTLVGLRWLTSLEEVVADPGVQKLPKLRGSSSCR